MSLRISQREENFLENGYWNFRKGKNFLFVSQPRPGFLRGFDMPLLVIVVALMVFGLVDVVLGFVGFSLGAYDGDAMYMFNRQLMWLGLGVVGAIVLAFL
jgi:cell division protein FtsW (lipid II flippase)